MTPLPSPQQLRYLVTLVELRHVGRAAIACSVTQSTLSSGILALERQLDTAILDRTAGKRVVITPLGLELAERARAALDPAIPLRWMDRSAPSPTWSGVSRSLAFA